MCFNALPKLADARTKKEVESNVRQFMEAIPKLKYCESQGEKYLISMLDVIVKSIKEVNAKIESRFECYIWNL